MGNNDALDGGVEDSEGEGAKRRGAGKWLLIPAAAALAVAAAYLAGVVYYQSHFLNGTNVLGTDISNMKVEDFQNGLADYKIKVSQKGLDGKEITEEISSEDMGVEVSSTDVLSKIIEEQNAWIWPARIKGKSVSYGSEKLISCDDGMLRDAVGRLADMQPENVVQSKDAYISDYIRGKGYEIIEEEVGNELDGDAAANAVKEAVMTLSPSVDCSGPEFYKGPEVTADDAALNELAERLNRYVGAKITYKFGGRSERIDGDKISGWIKIKNGRAVIKDKKVEKFVAMLHRKYDTIFGTREFKTSYGKTITVSGGDYGWWINTPAEVKSIKKLIKKGERCRRTPSYYQTAQSYGENDYGDTYVEVNLTAQHVILYVNGRIVVEGDCVTGNSSRGYDTPAGVYGITYKEMNATLTGENYATPVTYWMPFNKNIGLHDADWRSSFGGDIYRTSGSHGCVNLPPDVAEKIYENVEKGTPVICYHLDGTKSGSVAKSKSRR